MVTITKVEKRNNKTTGEEFVSLTLVGDLQIVKSSTGKISARIPTTNYPLPMTLETAVLANVVPGKQMEGKLEFTIVPEYEFTGSKGETLKSTRGVRYIDEYGEVLQENRANTSSSSTGANNVVTPTDILQPQD